MTGLAAVSLILAAAILYLLIGYPLSLLLRRQNPVHKEFKARSVTVLLAVRNGERWLDDKLATLTGLDYPRELIEIIVISDGSTDRTEAIAQGWHDRGVMLLARPAMGKSSALSAGLQCATGEILLFTDVRQRLARNSLRELVSCFHDPSVGVVSGELVIAEGESQEEQSVGLYWKYENWIRTRLSQHDSILGATGCIYAMRRALAVPMADGVLLDDVYLPLAAFFRGFRLILEPSAKAFDSPTSLVVEFRRKVRTQGGVYQILRHYPQLLGPRNRLWFDFVCHKLGRLLLPWLLIGLFVTSCSLFWPWRAAAVAQILFYLMALVDGLLPDGWRAKRFTSLIRTFVTLMAASACAIAIVFIPAGSLWQPAPPPPNGAVRER